MFLSKRSLFLLSLSLSPLLWAQSVSTEAATVLEVESDSNVSEAEELPEIDDIDSLFEDAEDTDEAVVTDEVKAGTDYNLQVGSIKFPIEVSGNMNTELGTGFIRQNHDSDFTLYFDFKNYIYFTTRPDKYLALKGVIKTSMPSDSDDTETSNLFYLYEMYFDYLMFNRVYITAGKKKSVWGNIRLFSDYYDDDEDSENSDSESNVNDAQYTNILYDSRDYISGIVKIPIGNHTFTGIGMYDEETSGQNPGTKNMSLAASAEFIVFNTSINFFGRRFPLEEDENKNNSQLPIVGLELKRTLFGFDLYGQSMGRVNDGTQTKDIFTSGLRDLSAFNRIVSTAGIYRLWSDNAPYVGLNFEFQNIYRPEPDDDVPYFTNRFAFQWGMAKLGSKKNIKLAFLWNHNINEKSGLLKTGIILSRIMPHCDWRNGVEYKYYGDEDTSNKLTIGSYLTISLDY